MPGRKLRAADWPTSSVRRAFENICVRDTIVIKNPGEDSLWRFWIFSLQDLAEGELTYL